jgi:hypothetical protein
VNGRENSRPETTKITTPRRFAQQEIVNPLRNNRISWSPSGGTSFASASVEQCLRILQAGPRADNHQVDPSWFEELVSNASALAIRARFWGSSTDDAGIGRKSAFEPRPLLSSASSLPAEDSLVAFVIWKTRYL